MPAKNLNGSTDDTNVKRLLRHRASCQYFKSGSWTKNPAEADNFSDVVQAAQTCARYGLMDVELALRFDAQANDDIFCTSLR